jgi:hypothetical protein
MAAAALWQKAWLLILQSPVEETPLLRREASLRLEQRRRLRRWRIRLVRWLIIRIWGLRMWTLRIGGRF